MKFETVIGLEVHVHLKTQTKAFCGCSTQFGSEPNSQTCPVCLGFPGSLPVLNEKVLEYAAKIALALDCTVQPFTKFDRKNYFYPDLPKAYQISQYDMPLALSGCVEIDTENGKKKIRIKRVHLEEDAGKLIHKENGSGSLVDYNRCGMPLLEIVTEPDIHCAQEAFEFLKNLKLIIQYVGVSDCDMEKGSLRCDANISLRPVGQKTLGVKTEVKNMNSFRGVRAALEHEAKRQEELLLNGKTITQETRLWNDETQKTSSMRSKEDAHDYRYFPDPDLVPFTFEESAIAKLKRELPELPQVRTARFVREFQFSEKETELLIADKSLGDLFEECVKLLKEPRKIFNWLTGSVLAYANERKKQIQELRLSPQELATLIAYVNDGKLSNLAAKDVLFFMLDEGKTVDALMQEKGLKQVSDAGELAGIVEKVISANPGPANDFRSGKENAVMFLVGQAMKLSQGKANPKILKELLIEKLKKA